MNQLIRYALIVAGAAATLGTAERAFACVTSPGETLCSHEFTSKQALRGIAGQSFHDFADAYPCSDSTLCSPGNDPVYANEGWSNFMFMLPNAGSKLLVFLPGGGTAPDEYQDFMVEAAMQGYRVIGLVYENVREPAECKELATHPAGVERPIGDQDACYSDIIGEKALGIYGGSDFEDDTDFDSKHHKFETNNGWNYGNGMVERLSATLAYLKSLHPHDHWDQFLTPCADVDTFMGMEVGGTIMCPDWSKVSFAAHSQGTKIATAIAQKYDLGDDGRVLFFSGEPDVLDLTDMDGNLVYDDDGKIVHETPSYIFPDGATPSSHYFSFDLHTSFTSSATKLNWDAQPAMDWTTYPAVAIPNESVGLGLPKTTSGPGFDPTGDCQDVDLVTKDELGGNRFTTSKDKTCMGGTCATNVNCDAANRATNAHYESIADCSIAHYFRVWDYMLLAPLPQVPVPN